MYMLYIYVYIYIIYKYALICPQPVTMITNSEINENGKLFYCSEKNRGIGNYVNL